MPIQTAADSISNSQGSPFGFKNRIINGAMVIDQRNVGAILTSNSGGNYAVDRWNISSTQNLLTIGQNYGSVTPPAGFNNYYGSKITTTGTLGANDYNQIFQIIEGYNMADFDWGTANAKSITLSFWVYSSTVGTWGGSIRNSALNRSYPFTYTINQANTWEYKTITIPGDTSGTWLTTNVAGMYLTFSYGAGSNYSGPAGAWAATNYNSATGAASIVTTSNATFYFTGVQLEKGSQATAFDYRPYSTELQLCYRYNYVWYRRGASSDGNIALPGVGSFYTSTTAYTNFIFPVTMRGTPSLTTPNRTNAFLFPSNGGSFYAPTVTMGHTFYNGCFIVGTTTSSATAGHACNSTLSTGDWVNGDYLGFSAEL